MAPRMSILPKVNSRADSPLPAQKLPLWVTVAEWPKLGRLRTGMFRVGWRTKRKFLQEARSRQIHEPTLSARLESMNFGLPFASVLRLLT